MRLLLTIFTVHTIAVLPVTVQAKICYANMSQECQVVLLLFLLTQELFNNQKLCRYIYETMKKNELLSKRCIVIKQQ